MSDRLLKPLIHHNTVNGSVESGVKFILWRYLPDLWQPSKLRGLRLTESMAPVICSTLRSLELAAVRAPGLGLGPAELQKLLSFP